ncbi:thiamine biosynthesis lipoprotein [Desulfonatronum zhilinae]|nr:thiamine biosynthesis lipoprotein [Desulfonatronum zhilinae]
MGTTYAVRVGHAPASALSGLEGAIRDRLERINASMSVYRPESEISRFNALTMGESMSISEDFEYVLRVSTQVYAQTGGAFDPTVKPLLDIWGFGPGAANRETWRPPSEEAVRHALSSVGLHLIDASTSGRLGKLHPDVQLDLGAVAKGFAVDALAELLEGREIQDYLVDIGGDVRVSGRNSEGDPWRVGLNRPERGRDWEDVLLVLRPGRSAVLTSGDYRQFFEDHGQFFSHVLDPRTGRPLENNVASVTVLAETAVLADALATGLMVLGVEKGLELVESLPEVEALFLVRGDESAVAAVRSSGFDRLGTKIPF